MTYANKKHSSSLTESAGKWAVKPCLHHFKFRGKILHDYGGIYQICQNEAGPVFSCLTCCILFLLPDKHYPVRMSGLKPSTLKQLGQLILQPPSAQERKVRVVGSANAYYVPVGSFFFSPDE